MTLQGVVEQSLLLKPLLARWHRIALPDAWLVAGAVAQTAWNALFGLPPSHGIHDVDIVYFDPNDLSEAAEAAHSARIRAEFADMPVWIDVKNEARVHLWYEAKFGFPIAPYPSTAAAIATFPTTATAIGIRPGESNFDLCAPFGLADLSQGIVRPNKALITRDIYEKKVARWAPLWPGLRIIPWEQPLPPAR